MKQPIFILSSLLCICGMQCAVASDSLEEVELEEPAVVEVIEEEEEPVDNIQISEEKYIVETMDELADTRARVNELLLVPNESSQNLWTDDAIIHNSASLQSVFLKPMKKQVQKAESMGVSLGDQSYYGETVYIINNFLSGGADNVSETTDAYKGAKLRAEYSDCPFKTQSECAIWLRKPIVSETVAPRSKKLRDSVMCDIETEIENNPNISANEKSMAPLMNRYKVLMRASQSCCTGGLMYRLQKAGATKKLVYKFLSDDANFSGFGSRCLVMTDDQIENTEKYQATSATVSDVRNNCICKSKTNLKALLAPFEQLYKEYPQFANAPFEYKHYDGVGRYVTDSVNADVQSVLNQLEMCP